MRCEGRNSHAIRMVVICCILLPACQCLIAHDVDAQEELDSLRAMWNAGRYSEVIVPLMDYRREEPYGKNLEVDYMIATSACRTPDLESEGYAYFRWILSHYDVEDSNWDVVIDEMSQCEASPEGLSGIPPHIDFASLYSTSGAAGEVRGKIYFWLDAENAPLLNDPVEVVRELTRDELRARLFEVSDADSAVRFLNDLVGSRYKVLHVGPFIIVSSSDLERSDLQTMGENLEKYFTFYRETYKMTAPSHLMTMYLVPDTWELRGLAEEIHGLRVSAASIGYSYRNDLSIVGVIPRKLYGTLAHELFHLMVRRDFGDIPPWMDEGIAALYEVSRIEGDSIVGLPNWRGRVLKELWNLRPEIADLVGMDWRAFDSSGEYDDTRKQAASHATARYFMLYLQEKQKLSDVFDAFRWREVARGQNDPAEEAVALLESILEMPLAEVDTEFTTWFRQLPD